MVNFASLDPTIDRKGMANVSALDRKVWSDFFGNIDYYLSIDEEGNEGFSDLPQTEFVSDVSYEATDVLALMKARRGQQRFRRAVLASYDHRCAISGISDERLLVASHIAPWATHKSRRLDPRNGICLNALFDRAFDTGLITLSDDCHLLFSPHLSSETTEKISNMGAKFNIPKKFAPDIALLREHRRHFGFL
jgi:putative restriction endonuclease